MKEPPAQEPLVMSLYRRGLYSSFGREKPLYKKLPFLADFIKNWAPLIKNSILTIFTDPKAKWSEDAAKNLIKSNVKNLCCNYFIVPHLLKQLL